MITSRLASQKVMARTAARLAAGEEDWFTDGWTPRSRVFGVLLPG
ncbi:hypothetical protein [Georgenia thermotolerans]|nr:hypothetical protein [Georgenia thermotolerans]